MIEGLPQKDSNILRALEPLLCSAFESKHRSIVNAAIMLWNSTFGSQATLEYPPCILVALRRLQGIADLQLPSFPKDSEDEVCVIRILRPIALANNSGRLRQINLPR